jgi:hydroxymethylpyrimidine pyrophosphatase-like HAD family hydrolase
VLDPAFPIDVLIFSSGAGVWCWQQQALLESHHLSRDLAAPIIAYLQAQALDFMVHGPVPDNHRLYFHRSRLDNHDFEARLRLYPDVAQALSGIPEDISQLLVVEPPETAAEVFSRLQQAFPDCSVIRATSPLDHASGWLEIFPAQVSKGQSAARLLAQRGLPSTPVMAIGNDYNDLDLLHWAPHAYIVANAPAELRAQFATVSAYDCGGFAEAVADWLPKL